MPESFPLAPFPDLGRMALDNTFGALLIGTFVGIALYGMVVHQSYRYFRIYPDDRIWTKLLVFTVLVFETFHIVCCTHMCYHYLVTNYDQPEALTMGIWSIDLLTVTSGLLVLVSQLFFARRVFLLGPRYRIIVGLAMILYLGETGFLAVATAQAFMNPYFVEFRKYTWLVSAGVGMAQVADMLLTAILIVVLRKNRTGVKRMDTVIDALVLYAMNTGIITSLANCLSLVFSILRRNDLIYVAFGIVCTKLYANSLLAALNSRKSLTLRAMYDLDESWGDVPVPPQRASYAVRHGPQNRSALHTQQSTPSTSTSATDSFALRSMSTGKERTLGVGIA